METHTRGAHTSTAPTSRRKPTVLVLSGLDPSGGAGLQADIQSITALGCHPLPLLTCLTVQNTHNVYDSQAVDAAFLQRQLKCLAADITFDAIKTGALGSAAVIEVICAFLQDYPDKPLVVDPVLVAAGGGPLADEALIAALQRLLLPMATLITPNGPELTTLGESEALDIAAERLLARYAGALLLTGGHGEGPHLVNQLYRRNKPLQQWQLPRLAGVFHGSGCTFAAAISAGLAKRQRLDQAIEQAQDWVHHSLETAFAAGEGQPIPNRHES